MCGRYVVTNSVSKTKKIVNQFVDNTKFKTSISKVTIINNIKMEIL